MSGSTRTLALALVLGLSASLLAQGGRGQTATQTPGGDAGGRFGLPPRDAVQQPTGTSVIRGRVLAAESGMPVRRAQIRATSSGLRAGRLATTDAQGRFELKDLPGGQWTLTASKAGFVTLQYGQRRPLESGRAIELRDGETLERADISLPRSSAITGHIFDEFGDPVAGARVQVLRYQLQQGIRRLVPTGASAQTDDTGAYRVYGLAPGDYFVSATLRVGPAGFAGPLGGIAAAGPVGDDSAGTAYAPTYYPGTGSLAEAQRFALGIAQEQSNVNFALLPVRTVRISGSALDASGRTLTGGTITLTASGDGALALNQGGNSTRVRDDGTFMLTNVTPGPYTLMALAGGGFSGRRGGGPGPANADVEFVAMPIVVGNDDLTGLTVVTTRGATISGSVVLAEGSSGELKTAGLQVVAQGVRPDLPGPFNGNRNVRVNDDATFTMTGVNGPRLIRLNGLPQQWTLKSVTLDSTDVTDTPFDIQGNERFANVQIVVTDRVTEVNGKVTVRGQPTKEYSVVIFPEDQTKWTYPTRFVQAARPDQQGLFKVRALPPGERYLAVAVDYLENGESADPEFLAEMRGKATRLTLAEGESKALDLRLIAR